MATISIKVEGRSTGDYRRFTVRRMFGKIRITGYTNSQGYDPEPFFGSFPDAIKYGDRHGFDLPMEVEAAGWKTE